MRFKTICGKVVVEKTVDSNSSEQEGVMALFYPFEMEQYIDALGPLNTLNVRVFKTLSRL